MGVDRRGDDPSARASFVGYARGMAARTPLSLTDARTLGEHWGLVVVAVEPVAAGTLNSSHALTTSEGRVFLRICEHVGAAEAEIEARLLAHLAASGVPTPAPLALADGSSSFVARHQGKPAIALQWIDGAIVCARAVVPAHAFGIGAALATVHAAAQCPVPAARFEPTRLAARLAALAVPHERRDLLPTIMELQRRLARLDTSRLPVRGVIHGDLFRENALWSEARLSAVVDFEAACAGNFAYDLMIAAHAWCFGDRFEPARARALLAGYRTRRALGADEVDELYPAAQAAAIRFAVTRLADYELAPQQPPLRDHRRFLARLAEVEALGPRGWHDLLEA